MAAIEVDRRTRSHEARESSHSREERDRLTRQLRAASEKSTKAWDEGFAAAVDMMRRGASMDQMYSMMRGVPPELPNLARAGTREFVGIPMETAESEEKTEPMIRIPFAPEGS